MVAEKNQEKFRALQLKFLFFLYYYPPAFGTAPKRNHLISSAISRWTAFSKIFTSAPGYTTGEEVETISAFDYRSFLRKKTKDGALPEKKKKSKSFQALVKLINVFPVNIMMGEGGLLYFLSLVRKGNRTIKSHGITHIYSSFRPFTDHYAAFILKKRYPHLVWIADFRDLIIDPHYQHIYLPDLHQRFFRRVFRRADVLTTVSDGLAEHLRAYNPNAITLRNGIRAIPETITPVYCKYFRIAYTGSMFLDKRNARPLFTALHELITEGHIKRDDVRIVYAGKDSRDWTALATSFGFDSIVDTKGIVPSAEATAIQHAAGINVLLTVSSKQLKGVLTGKMIEYFEAGSPVLGIVVNQNDPELSYLLEELEIGKSFSDHPSSLPGIKEFILYEFTQWRNTGMNRKPVNLEVLREKYAIENTMRPLFEFLEKKVESKDGMHSVSKSK